MAVAVVDATLAIKSVLITFISLILDNLSHILTKLVNTLRPPSKKPKMETTKPQKSNTKKPNPTLVNRNAIDANWQKLLSSNVINDKKYEKPVQENRNQHYSGYFRRARKKHQNTPITVENTANTPQEKVSDIQNDIKSNKNDKTNNNSKQTKFVAMDCEMVGIGYNGDDHMLARVSLVNKFGDCIYDKFVKAREEVVDYRTSISGVRKEDMLNGEDFTVVQREVAEILRGKILVGHSLKNDLSVLFLSHPKRNIRDTAKYKPFRSITKGGTPSLKRLAKEILGFDIQHGEHSSVEDARAVMKLYCSVAKKWEASLSGNRGYTKVKET